MSRFVLAWLLTLLLPALCLGEGPVIRHRVGNENGQASFNQPMDLCIEGDGPWSLWADADFGLSFTNLAGELVQQGRIASGVGPGQSTHVLDVSLELGPFGVGRHQLGLKVTLEGAQGILGLPLSTAYWVLPLNSDQVQVFREGQGFIAVPSGRWFLLQERDGLYYGEKEVVRPSVQVEALQVLRDEEHVHFWWDTVPSKLEPAAWGKVKLLIKGPSPGGEFALRTNPNLRLGDPWTLEGEVLDSVTMGDSLILSLPSLGPGIYELQGSVQALLPLSGGEGGIWASWQGREVGHSMEIDRSWFDFAEEQNVSVDTSSPLLLPSGTIQRRGMGKITVLGDALDVIIPLENPREPIWTGLPLLESTTWRPQPDEAWSEDFFLPVFLWDQGFSWRLVANSGSWFFDASAERQHVSLRGQARTIRVERNSVGSITLSSSVPSFAGDGGWRWQETSHLRRGTYHKGNWRWTLDIPRDAEEIPSLTARYSDQRFGLLMTSQDISFRLTSDNWSWGAGLNPLALWIRSQRAPLRVEVGRGRIRLDYKPEARGQMNLEMDAKGLQLDLSAEPWQANLSLDSNGSVFGLRYRRAFSEGPWRFATQGGLQFRNELILTEVKGQLGLELGPACTLYVEGLVNHNHHLKKGWGETNFRYGGGVIVRPLPELVTLLGWDSQKQWQLKIGVVVPFVGRKSNHSFE